MKASRLLSIYFVFLPAILSAQQFTQVIRGQVVDKQSQFSLPGATVVVANTDPVIGTTTDADGRFRLEGVPVGRQTIQVTFIGYEPAVLGNVNVTSSKEVILKVAISESVTKMKEVVIVAEQNKEKPLNEMASVSARTFSIEESQRFAGARNDVARMASNFAGVSTPNDATNDIVIRGNSPNGLLWRLEGVDIPNPNHFGDGSASGGPVSMLNNNVLDNSDFLTAAFPAEYGNALSGVFDLRMRSGNNQKHEFLGQIGFNGVELGAEGPISRKNGSSYLINYRYSTLAFFDALGINLGTGVAVPQYQDLTFKLNFPTRKAGVFSVFGLAGTSFIDFVKSDVDSADVADDFYADRNRDVVVDTRQAVAGINHTYFWDSKTYSRLTLSASAIQNELDVDSIIPGIREPFDYFNQDFRRYKLSAAFFVNRKISARHTVKAGFFATQNSFDFVDSLYKRESARFRTLTDEQGATFLWQPYAEWQWRPAGNITVNTGLHTAYLALTDEVSVEPRFGIRWQAFSRHTFSFGYGLHSQVAPLDAYYQRVTLADGSQIRPNQDLQMSKSHHLVVGYDWNIGRNFRLKAEGYYQHIFDAVVEQNPSSYSILNAGSFTNDRPDSLTNGGYGYNTGIELTLEKFITNGVYFLGTISIFESQYKGSDDVWRNTAFNGNYVVNALGGKEFELFSGKEKKQKHFLTVDSKITWAGGNWYTPVDLEKSLITRQNEFLEDQAFSQRLPDYFRLDFRLAWRSVGKKVTSEYALDIQNITNRQNVFSKSFNPDTGEVETVYQLGLFPVVQYRIMF